MIGVVAFSPTKRLGEQRPEVATYHGYDTLEKLGDDGEDHDRCRVA
jgi:hypothetical protein